ncbi:MAG TPA: gamma-glutamyltransferase [Thermomicrobiales bacterium]|nr:gamma-glutamyltransferase [Thermomicrobiales bacterium]
MTWPNKGLAHRPVVMGRRGAVASANPLATLAGLRMLLAGGNAIDAIVATAAALNVAEPYMSGAGGVGYMVIKSAREDKPVVLDFIGRAPAAATLDVFTKAGAGSKDFGILSPLVPGNLGGWLTALERYGTMDRKAVFTPAIEYAEVGVPVTISNNALWGHSVERLGQWPTSAAAYLRDGGAPKTGTIMQYPNLAKSFRAIVEGGKEVFYKGSIATEIARFSQANGGIITAEDLATYEPQWQTPISTTYRGYEVICPPLPCSGMQYLETLNLVEGYDMAGLGQNSAEYIHYLAEAMKLAVADRTTYAPNPDSPIEWLLSKDYAAQRRGLIAPQKAAYSGGERYTSHKLPQEVRAGSPAANLRESTTHLVAIDAQGNAVACTQTLGAGFGSGVVHGDTGLLLNNFFHWFDDDPESPNVIAPNKKVEMCLAPSQIWRDGRLFMMVGTPGSFGIMQTTPQMMMNVLDHGFSIQAAIEAPRFRTGTGYELPIENRVAPEVVAELERRGHQVQLLDPWTMFVGGGQGVMVDPDSGAFLAGADPRRDGYAMAF